MRISRSMMLAAMALVLAMMSTAARADQVANPKYSAWSKFGVGSSQTLESTTNAQNMVIHTTLTRTLKEKTDDHVTIEVSTTIDVGGQEHKIPPRTQTEPAKVDNVDAKETGAEDVSAAGKTFHCKVWEANATAPQGPQGAPGAAQSKAKIWVSDEVPGGAVKMEMSSPSRTMTFTLKSFEAK